MSALRTHAASADIIGGKTEFSGEFFSGYVAPRGLDGRFHRQSSMHCKDLTATRRDVGGRLGAV
eukprot:7301292-Pyramimonas_sp.AAC.3